MSTDLHCEPGLSDERLPAGKSRIRTTVFYILEAPRAAALAANAWASERYESGVRRWPAERSCSILSTQYASTSASVAPSSRTKSR